MSSRLWTADEIRALGARTDLVTAGSVLGIGRTKSYEMARNGTFPIRVLRLGHRYVCPVSALLRFLELDLEPSALAQPAAAPQGVDYPVTRAVS